MNAVAIIQARMTSSRFPGKVLQSLVGRPLLWHIVTRVARAETVRHVVVACSTRPEDDAIETFCHAHGFACVRGSETDVLDRFRIAADKAPADVYVRICGDSPLVAPDWIDRCVHALVAADGGYTRVESGHKCVHAGVDVISADALRRLLREVPTHPVAREHVTGYFTVDPEFAPAVDVSVPADVEGEARLSVDVPEDLEYFARLYAEAEAEAGELEVTTALEVLRARPQLRLINAQVQQRRVDEKPAAVMLFGEGGGDIGWGHLSRLVVLANSLRRAGANPVVAYEGGEEVKNFLQHAGLTHATVPDGVGRSDWLRREIPARHIDALVVDTCGRVTAEDLRHVRTTGTPILLLDDKGERTHFADAVFNPPAPQLAEPPLHFTGQWHTGWDQVPLRDDFLREYPPAEDQTLLITMGGSDPRNFTARAVRALGRLPEARHWQLRIILGSSYRGRADLERALNGARLPAAILHATPHMAQEMAAAKALLISFGVTAYEGAAIGRPMACYCLSADHREHAGVFVNQGLATVMGDDPANDAEQLHAWLGRVNKPRSSPCSQALRQGTAKVTREILRWSRERPATLAAA